jgi:hypothetical protein
MRFLSRERQIVEIQIVDIAREPNFCWLSPNHQRRMNSAFSAFLTFDNLNFDIET